MAFGKKYNKYGNKKTTVDGIKFDSLKESARYLELKQREKFGFIRNIELQPKYILQEKYRDSEGKAIREIAYFADFKYYDIGQCREIVEDVKGSPKFLDPIYKLKKKLLLYKYRDLNFIEVYKVSQ